MVSTARPATEYSPSSQQSQLLIWGCTGAGPRKAVDILWCLVHDLRMSRLLVSVRRVPAFLDYFAPSGGFDLA